jgi:hypothetical protein
MRDGRSWGWSQTRHRGRRETTPPGTADGLQSTPLGQACRDHVLCYASQPPLHRIVLCTFANGSIWAGRIRWGKKGVFVFFVATLGITRAVEARTGREPRAETCPRLPPKPRCEPIDPRRALYSPISCSVQYTRRRHQDSAGALLLPFALHNPPISPCPDRIGHHPRDWTPLSLRRRGSVRPSTPFSFPCEKGKKKKKRRSRSRPQERRLLSIGPPRPLIRSIYASKAICLHGVREPPASIWRW